MQAAPSTPAGPTPSAVPDPPEAAGAPPTHSSILVLAVLFLAVSLGATVVAFVYPLEIETREGTVWLHAITLRDGVNIYDPSRVAYVNMNHGPMDPVLKAWMARFLPFLRPWQVARLPVLLLPALFLWLAWRVPLAWQRLPAGDVVYLGGMGFVFLLVTAKEFLLVGRSDATAACLLLLQMGLAVCLTQAAWWRLLIHGLAGGALGAVLMLTNWRIAPVAVLVMLFSSWRCWRLAGGSWRQATGHLAAGVMGCLVILFWTLAALFHLDAGLYFQRSMGFYDPASGWGAVPLDGGGAVRFVIALFNPTASTTALKGGPVLLGLAVVAWVPHRRGPQAAAWLCLGGLAFALCAVAYYFNYVGGGQWYFIPFLVILWFFLVTGYHRMPARNRQVVGMVLLALVLVNPRTVLRPTWHRLATMGEAARFMTDVRQAARQQQVASEDLFFHLDAYGGELIDMGDEVAAIADSGYYGAVFDGTAERHFRQLRENPPPYILTGFTASPEMNRLIAAGYFLLAAGPDNFTANGGGRSRLYRRRDRFRPQD